MADAKSYERAREMRSALTPPEARLWTALKSQQMGVRFRRQHPVGPYILDFYCASAKLAVEVDGMIHSDPDRRRMMRAERDGWRAGGFGSFESRRFG